MTYSADPGSSGSTLFVNALFLQKYINHVPKIAYIEF